MALTELIKEMERQILENKKLSEEEVISQGHAEWPGAAPGTAAEDREYLMQVK